MCTLTEQLKEIKLDSNAIKTVAKLTNAVRTVDDLPPANSRYYGDCIYVVSENSMYMNIDSHHWELLSGNNDNKTENNPVNHASPKICTRCGAPLKMYARSCEYCGTCY